MNPHPTRSKPAKIGRKHTGAPGLRIKGKRQAGAKAIQSNRQAKARKFKAAVAEYWRGQGDYPA